jgi:aspartate/methionine/tyrosine aminotransferase
MFSERFSNLPAYAFPRLRGLLDGYRPGGDTVHMTIGEPRHPFPDWVSDILRQHAAEFDKYPPNEGTPELLCAISAWLEQRYRVTLDPTTQIMALNGSREGLYNAAIGLCPDQKFGKPPVILIPNPFYQVYMVAAMSVGAEPVFVPATRATGYLPDYRSVDSAILERTAIVYICTPSNPQGAVASADYWRDLIALAEQYDFQIFSDECYSEIYRGQAPVGGLEIAAEMAVHPERVLVFHSLSKRSNLPGLRSGFVAGGPKTLAQIKQLRAYSGAPLPLPLQRVAERAWADEAHVVKNRQLYDEKFTLADTIFASVDGYQSPAGGFFLWLPVKDGEQAAVRLWTSTGVRVLPGAYLAKDINGVNPGQSYIRVALVAPKPQMAHSLRLLHDCLWA